MCHADVLRQRLFRRTIGVIAALSDLADIDEATAMSPSVALITLVRELSSCCPRMLKVKVRS
jgi:hypothetical protein